MHSEFLTLPQAAAKISSGAIMAIAGDPALLAQLPKGDWIGGSAVYFVTEQGGEVLRDQLHCTIFNDATRADIRVIGAKDVSTIAQGYIAGGITMILIPAFGDTHSAFALQAAQTPALFGQPLFGWVAGVHLDEIGHTKPTVYDGRGAEALTDAAVVLHLGLPQGITPDLDIVNIFTDGGTEGVDLVFDETGFAATRAQINGQEIGLAEFLTQNAIDTRLPLIADYGGAKINVSIREIDPHTGRVDFYAPVMAGVTYRLARGLPDYAEAFASGIGGDHDQRAACNCILNYLYGAMEGRAIAGFRGPMTFGEIAYMLLNQTLVRLDLRHRA